MKTAPSVSVSVLSLLFCLSTATDCLSQSSATRRPPVGDQQRSYLFPDTGESIPFHLYVPTTWDGTKKAPLVVVLHGDGAAPESMFERNDGILGKLAQKLGYIVVAPTGYVSNGRYNARLPTIPAVRAADAALSAPPPDIAPRPAPRLPLTDLDRERSEQDVLNVSDLIIKEYNVDVARVYLLGNSAGGAGVWHLAQKFPERWAAIAPCAAPLSSDLYPFGRLKELPVLVVHGDKDDRTSFDASLLMVERAKMAGVNATFVPVQGGDHFGSWATAAPEIFEFFNRHQGIGRK